MRLVYTMIAVGWFVRMTVASLLEASLSVPTKKRTGSCCGQYSPCVKAVAAVSGIVPVLAGFRNGRMKRHFTASDGYSYSKAHGTGHVLFVSVAALSCERLICARAKSQCAARRRESRT